jgi:glycosyltransferase involved in cell wall biosynthesis
MTNSGPFVSVIVPCMNEEKFIGRCLDSLIIGDYPSDRMEILVVDGGSTDRTLTILNSYSERWKNLRVLPNPRSVTPAGLNIGVRAARGELLIRIDAHCEVATNYVRRCVDISLASGADNVGGIMKTLPQNEGVLAEAIVECLSHRFGVGGSRFRTGTLQQTEVDTVFGGCYRRDVFKRIGYWNEAIQRSQDMEFNKRLRRAGGRIILDPEIICYYYARSDFKSFMKHNWTNGMWATLPFIYCDDPPVSWRHLIPLFFVLSLSVACALSVVDHLARWSLYCVVIAYFMAAAAASIDIALRKRKWRLAFLLPFAFALLHFGYGLGSAWGLVQAGVFLIRANGKQRTKVST